jgi:NAD(P)-dependent dehydrogenase (short-subunit alcohol dehydrogenase family)
MPVTQQILITGAAGQIGSWLRRSLRQPDRHLRLLDIAVQGTAEADEDVELIVASCTDEVAMLKACEGVDVVLHLGGLSTGGYAWEEYLDVNVNGTFNVFEAARRCGVPRVVFASSNHAVGFLPADGETNVSDYAFPRPDSLYGVSKVAGESLGSLYHDRHGLDVLCLRIGSFRPRPTDQRSLWNWLSPGDCTRLFEAAIAAPQPGYRVVWGVSANSKRITSLDEGRAIGYVPTDNAQDYAAEIVESPTTFTPDGGVFIGGPFTAPDFD